MKKYLIFSTLSYVMISLLVNFSSANDHGFMTFAAFSWYISPELLTLKSMMTCVVLGAVLSVCAYFYIQPKTALVDGFRFGLISGLVIMMVVLFNMMIHVEHDLYAFFAESLLSLVSIQLLGFVLMGWLFGLIFKISTKHTVKQVPFSYFW